MSSLRGRVNQNGHVADTHLHATKRLANHGARATSHLLGFLDFEWQASYDSRTMVLNLASQVQACVMPI